VAAGAVPGEQALQGVDQIAQERTRFHSNG